MIAFLNQNDIDNLKQAVDKMKSVDFDAARKMELLLEAYEQQDEGAGEIAQYQEAIEALSGWSSGTDYLDHVKDTADLLERAADNAQAWDEAKDDEPLDEAVKRLVKAAEAEDPRVAKMESALMDILQTARKGEPDAFSRIRELAEAALP